MNRTQYRTARRSTRDNGHAYTIHHAHADSRATLQRLHDIGAQLDHLLERQRWAANPDTTPANIVRLTTPQQ